LNLMRVMPTQGGASRMGSSQPRDSERMGK